jgi:tetratricopeptide (TPR) repeat protein
MNQRLEKLLKMNDEKQTEFLLFALAKEYEQIGDTQNALNYYQILEKDYENNTGFYYHFAKLLFQMQEITRFREIIKKGQEVCKAQKDTHALAELTGLYNECIEDDE